MPSVMFGVNLWIKSRGDGMKLWMMKTEEEVRSLPVIVVAGQADKGKELPAPPGGARWKEIALTYSVSPFSPPSEVRVNVLEKLIASTPGGTMSDYDTLQGFRWEGEVSPGAGSFLTAEYLKPGASPRGAASPLGLLVPRQEVLYAPTTTHDIGIGRPRGGGGHHHHGGGRRGGRGWGGGPWGGWGWYGGPLYAEDLPVIIVDGVERKMTEAEWEAEKKRREEAKNKKKALASFVDSEALNSGAQFGQGPDDIEFRPMSVIEALEPNTYATDWRSFMGDVDKAVNSAWASMQSELRARGMRFVKIPTNQAVVGDFVVTANCKFCTIVSNHAQGGLVLREIHPNKGQLWHYQPGIDPAFACAFGVRR